MSAQNLLTDSRRLLLGKLDEIKDREAVSAKESVDPLVPGHGHLLHVLGELDGGGARYADHLIDAAQRRLSLTRHQVGSGPECCDAVALLIQNSCDSFYDSLVTAYLLIQ